MNALILTLLLFQGDVQIRAKVAFDQVKICSCEKCNCIDCKCSPTGCTCSDCINKAKNAFAAVKIECLCQNCDCVDCKCSPKDCTCVKCNDFQAVYTKSIKENKVIVLSVGTSKPDLGTLPWTVIEVKTITGEKPGYIVGVPKDGKLVRLNFKIGTPRERLRLDVLHVIYPLTDGYVECPTCPQGRIKGPTVTKMVAVGYRNPIGHTHTCTSCGATWDHTANPTHTCANCGGHPPMSNGGYLADPTPRMVLSKR